MTERFGRWIVTSYMTVGRAICKCDCGTEKIVLTNNLRSGKTLSCGCYRKEYLSELKTNGGKANPRLYAIWCKMKDRCYNRNVKDYKNYGFRNIQVCDEWKNDFPTFLKWSFDNGYEPQLTIDRMDNNGNYSPDNCKWSTRTEQNNNKRNNNFITINGIRKTVTEWAEYSGLSRKTIQSRIKYGWSNEDLILPTKGVGANGTTAR
jgi:hypothetical protein